MHKITHLLKKLDYSLLLKENREFENNTHNVDYTSTAYIKDLKKYNKNLEIISLYQKAEKLISDLIDTKQMLLDNDLKDLAEKELEAISQELDNIYLKIEALTVKPLDNDDKKAIFEIRPGVGGVEASIFAEDLFNMYQKYCTNNNLKFEIYSLDYNNEGGINEVSFIVDIDASYSMFRFESGVHRVQRVPKTETLGRVHTSTASVVVMPEADENSININQSDLRIDVYRSSGPGGQSVNTTDSAVRITHIPSKITVTCQTSKSQHKNKEMALKILISRLKEIEDERLNSQVNSIRNNSIKGSKRASKIRTYNFPQGRITDHRIGKSWFNINNVVYGGELEDLLYMTNKVIRSGETLSTEDIED